MYEPGTTGAPTSPAQHALTRSLGSALMADNGIGTTKQIHAQTHARPSLRQRARVVACLLYRKGNNAQRGAAPQTQITHTSSLDWDNEMMGRQIQSIHTRDARTLSLSLARALARLRFSIYAQTEGPSRSNTPNHKQPRRPVPSNPPRFPCLHRTWLRRGPG